jgi:hypothetical protein
LRFQADEEYFVVFRIGCRSSSESTLLIRERDEFYHALRVLLWRPTVSLFCQHSRENYSKL